MDDDQNLFPTVRPLSRYFGMNVLWIQIQQKLDKVNSHPWPKEKSAFETDPIHPIAVSL